MHATSRSHRVLCFAILSATSLTLATAAVAAEVSIAFQVKVPESTPPDAKIVIVGDAPALGAWRVEKGVALKRGDKAEPYIGQVKLATDRPVEFKVTRGTWATVEKHADGGEMANRTLTPTRDATVEIEVAAWADQVRPPATQPAKPSTRSTRSGDVRLHPRLHSKMLNNERDLWVYLPPGYEREPDRRYPVLYLQDGQNLFDAATSFAGEWNVDETAERLIAEKKMQPVIIVGIGNTADRVAEYTPFADPKHGGGNGSAYADFLVREVKPFIDATYRTRPGRDDTGVGGSSLGGLVSLHIARRYPLQFSRVAVISPALWWNDGAILTTTETRANWLAGKKFWIDMGTAEGGVPGGADDQAGVARPARGVEDVTALGAALKRRGLVEGVDYVVRLVEGAKHDEAAWSARLDQVLVFLFPA